MEEYQVVGEPAFNAKQLGDALNIMTLWCHQANKNWWLNLKTGEPFDVNDKNLCGTKMMLMVSEVAEAMEGNRKDLMDDKLPHRKMEEVELADAVIRIFDYAYARGLDLGGAFVEKMEYNASRADHKIENRVKDGGKKF